MKSDHRHELKSNELADWIANFPDWARANRNTILATVAVILVALLVYFWSFYRRDVLSVRHRTELTSLVTQVPQQMNQIASAAMKDKDDTYILVETQKDLQDFAQKSSNDNMAALALIQRGAALRAEVHYRLAELSRDELATQIGKAQASYQEALDRQPSSPALAAAANYGLGLCEEELSNFDKAAEIYRTMAQKPEYTGTTAQAAAAHRLKIMNDFRTEVVFAPAPPKPVQPATPQIQIKPGDPKASAPTIQIQPGAPSAPATAPAPAAPTTAPAAPSSAAPTPAAPTPTPGAAPASSSQPATPPAGGTAPPPSDTNAPKSN
ncbi:MAG: tetratricopeptide repeat protein [Planctomycetes bacterium]|jgi:hypothetical protein|nr:tetratricopeptide repeat protein [Planctomycetota bacterium]